MALQYTPRQDEIRQAPAPMLEEPQPFDVAAQRQEMNQTLVGSAEVDALVSQICVNDPQTIVSFGGLSVIGQSVSMAAGSGIRLADILQIKLMHGIFSGLVAMFLVRMML